MTTITPLLIDEIKDLLQSGCTDVLSTTFNVIAQPAPVDDFRRGYETLVAGSVGFTGDVNGLVYIYVRAPFARTLTGQMLGFPEDEIDGDEMVNDVIGELSNMIVGSAKSRLCDSGNSCHLTIPSITRGNHLSAEPTQASQCRLLSFTCDDDSILIELLMRN
jgi:chemotaxis protein CheX